MTADFGARGAPGRAAVMREASGAGAGATTGSAATSVRRLTLAPLPTAPREAREFVATACREWDAMRFAERATLVVSELVSNAVVHTATEAQLTVRYDGTCLRVEVHDSGGGVPAVVPPERRDIGGVGLEIVSRCAREWGTEADGDGGKTVWAVLK